VSLSSVVLRDWQSHKKTFSIFAPSACKTVCSHFSKEWASVSEKHFFQQDGARPHTANAVLDVLNENFDGSVLSNRFPERFGCGWSWPPYSSDVNPCDYFLWGFLKDTVSKNNPHAIEELQYEMSVAVISVSEETLAAVVRHFRRRQSVLHANGAQIEDVFTWLSISQDYRTQRHQIQWC
jgi:hypothetical protein